MSNIACLPLPAVTQAIVSTVNDLHLPQLSAENQSNPTSPDENKSGSNEESILGEHEHEQDIPRDNATEIIQWLFENYSCSGNEKRSIPRSDVYSNYEQWCQQRQHTCYNAAMFGKIFKQAFPSVHTRRIGGREKSKYHYAGVVKRTQQSVDEYATALLLSQVKTNPVFNRIAVQNTGSGSGSGAPSHAQHTESATPSGHKGAIIENPLVSNLKKRELATAESHPIDGTVHLNCC
jgi:hypothetical protein